MQGKTQVETRVNGDIGIIQVTGEITSFSEQQLNEVFEKLTADGLRKIGMSFTAVNYINSAGMAIIIGLLTKGRKLELKLVCWGLTDHFQKIFDMVGITKYIQHFDSEEAALKAL